MLYVSTISAHKEDGGKNSPQILLASCRIMRNLAQKLPEKQILGGSNLLHTLL